MYLTIEVDDVDALYRQIKAKGVAIKIELRDEPWGDRHFAIEDPNGIGIDLEPIRKLLAVSPNGRSVWSGQ